MTSRERIHALLRREIPDQMGLYEHWWPETLPTWQEQGYPEGADPTQYFNLDMRGVNGAWYNTALRVGVEDEIIEETDEWVVRKNANGATLKWWKHKSGTPEHIDFDITTPEKWQAVRENLLALDTNRIDIEAVRADLQNGRKQDKFLFFANIFVFEYMRATLGDLCMLESLALEPEWIKDICQTLTKHFKIHYDYMIREAGKPDGVFIYEDLGFKNRLFCSPRMLRELVLPSYTELVGFFHDHGLPVMIHTCGDIREAVPLIIEAGFDCLQPMEAKAGNDLVQLAETYGTRISYMGNMNIMVFNTNDKDQVTAEIQPKLQAMQKMRIPYIFHSDHSVPPTVDLETYQHALEVFRANASYE